MSFDFFFFKQVIRRLRERGEPIRLFGETDYDAFQRLRKIEILTPEVNKVRSQNKAGRYRCTTSTRMVWSSTNCLIIAKMENMVARLLLLNVSFL